LTTIHIVVQQLMRKPSCNTSGAQVNESTIIMSGRLDLWTN